MIIFLILRLLNTSKPNIYVARFYCINANCFIKIVLTTQNGLIKIRAIDFAKYALEYATNSIL